MSLSTWTSRKVSRFWKLTWRSWLWPWSPPAGDRPRPGLPPRSPTQIRLESLENRETPLDILGWLRMPFAMGGITLLSGQLPTPFSVWLEGWVSSFHSAEPQPLLVGPSSQTPVPAQRPSGEPLLPANPTSAAGSGNGAGGFRSAGEALSGFSEPGVNLANPADDFPEAGWLNTVAAFLDSPATKRPALATPPELPESRGGGGGGGGGGSSGAGEGGGAGAFDTGTHPGSLLLLDEGSGSTTPAAQTQTQSVSTSSDSTASSEETQTIQEAVRASEAAQPSLANRFGSTRLPFELNVGQTDSSVRFLSRGAGFSFWLTRDEMVFGVARTGEGEQSNGRDVFRLRLLDVNANAELVGRDQCTRGRTTSSARTVPTGTPTWSSMADLSTARCSPVSIWSSARRLWTAESSSMTFW